MSKVLSTTVTFGKYTDIAINKLKKAGHQVILNETGRYYTEIELIQLGQQHPETEALIVGGDHITPEVIDAFPTLKVIAMHGVGVDKIASAYASTKQIIVTNTPGANSIDVAEYVLALMITYHRQLYYGIHDMKQGNWEKRVGQRLAGKTLGIIGVGSIGLALAKCVTGLGLTLLGYDPYPVTQAISLGVTYVPLDELLASADIIALHSPVSKNQPPLINQASIQLLKPTALVINAARAPLVDLKAVEAAIASQQLGGFITDVYEVEPPEDCRLWHYDNVLMTPHGGGGTIQANMAMGEMAADNVLAVLSTGQGLNQVREA